jgi:N-succinyldiaminopimelate aminotransferase
LRDIVGIGVDRMGSLADASGRDFLRLENLDTDIPPDAAAIAGTRTAAGEDATNSYLPFVGQDGLRLAAARHLRRCLVSPMTACAIASSLPAGCPES